MISNTEGEIMAVRKKKKEFSPSKTEQLESLAAKKVELARKEIEELKKSGIKIDPELANAAKRPGRPYRCKYPAGKRYNLKMPDIFHSFLKEKSEKEDVPMRELILDAISEQYDEEIYGEEA
jgi:hypothetical protein